MDIYRLYQIYHTGRFLLKQFRKRNSESSNLIAGSEEAVINLSRELTQLGWNITVYNSCGNKPVSHMGVTYCPFWEFNPWDRQDVVVLWRWPRNIDLDINADKIFLDMH